MNPQQKESGGKPRFPAEEPHRNIWMRQEVQYVLLSKKDRSAAV